ncbi:AtpZ/AtpI family protein [Paenibacillus thiaminolyticus]|uniref:AtpZ/AtpI family protein n=1 Tax=Paenibacillus thiaminolyticus TaxID=49283 RepID=UPI0035A61926
MTCPTAYLVPLHRLCPVWTIPLHPGTIAADIKKPPTEVSGLCLLGNVLLSQGAGVTLAVYIVIGYFAGKWLAQMLDGPKLWLAVGMIAGMCLGIMNIIYFVMKFMGEQDE